MTPPTIAVSIDLDAAGKRIVVAAGIHGDEYEGLVIARKLVAEILPDAITGRIVVMPGVNWPAVTATIDDLFEHSVDIGAKVDAGDVAGQVWPIDDLSRSPVALRFACGGIVLARRTMPMVVCGDYVCHVGEPMSDDDFQRGM